MHGVQRSRASSEPGPYLLSHAIRRVSHRHVLFASEKEVDQFQARHRGSAVRIDNQGSTDRYLDWRAVPRHATPQDSQEARHSPMLILIDH
jgi:hypothetical protein